MLRGLNRLCWELVCETAAYGWDWVRDVHQPVLDDREREWLRACWPVLDEVRRWLGLAGSDQKIERQRVAVRLLEMCHDLEDVTCPRP